VHDGVHTGAVGQAGVNHRHRLVDAAATWATILSIDAAEVVLVDEGDAGLLELALALHVDQVRAVHMTSETLSSRSRRSIGP